jgi:bifunctional non-homologous end joining protein LigD
MKGKLIDSRPVAGAWIYEIKIEGYRALALRGGNETRILSRNQKDLGKKFPKHNPCDRQTRPARRDHDGEILALDDRGRSSFQLLQLFNRRCFRHGHGAPAYELLRFRFAVT